MSPSRLALARTRRIFAQGLLLNAGKSGDAATAALDRMLAAKLVEDAEILEGKPTRRTFVTLATDTRKPGKARSAHDRT